MNTLKNINDKKLEWSPAALEIFGSLTVDELIALVDLKKKWDQGAYDDPDDRDEVLRGQRLELRYVTDR